MLDQPFYDPTKSYEENYLSGPYGAFKNNKKIISKSNPKYTFLGQTINLPFGIPAGPILNSKFAKAAFEKGFDLVVYKTVRSNSYPCHPYPNILPVQTSGNLTTDKLQNPLITSDSFKKPLTITNSFGVPSKTPQIWQEDVRLAINEAGSGQVLILSFMGTVKPNQTEQEFIDDYTQAAKLSNETGAKILEVNLSCPNVGNEGLVCYNINITKKIIQSIRKAINNTPLIIKIGYFQDDKQLLEISHIANEYANSIAAINTLQAEVRDAKGDQALPGPNRLRSGICGTSIKWAGLEMVKRLNQIKQKNNFKFSIEGIGGVMKPEDYKEYKTAGADSVMSATGAMWNPHLAHEIKNSL